MEMMGKTLEVSKKVTEDLLAVNVGSGNVSVYATPMMIALMEQAAATCVADCLEEGQTTVGTCMNTSHVAATPCGMNVTAKATVTAVNGRSIDFKVEAYDECGLIGEGTHSRVIVFKERFEQKTQEKLK